MAGRIPSPEEVLGYFQSCNNQGKWGADDQLGTINYITPAERKRAAQLVSAGVSVTCSRPISAERAPDVLNPIFRYMIKSGDQWAGKKSPPGQMQSAADYIGLPTHSPILTHIDSLAHVFWNGHMYNGRPADKVSTAEGATVESIDLLRDGIVTRGGAPRPSSSEEGEVAQVQRGRLP